MKITAPGPHLDHLLRQTRMHHVQLSSMADMKANMLLTMSALVCSLAAPQVLKGSFQWPFVILIVFSLTTICLAAIAVMPKVSLSTRHTSSADVNRPDFNLLFFGDFVHLTYEEYEAAMEELLNDPSRAYEAQVREVYTLGVFLVRKKYRFLRLGYLTFIIGLIASFVAVLLSHFLS